MKNLIFTMLILCTAFVTVEAQDLMAHAGRDTSVCPTAIETYLGAMPAATGGQGNYTYHWDIYPKPFVRMPGFPQFDAYASDFLDDTTSANPLLLGGLPENNSGPVSFILTVTDDSGHTAVDTVEMYRSAWTFLLGYIVIPATVGDTHPIHLSGGGGVMPVVVDWGPQSYLVNQRYDTITGDFDTFREQSIVMPANVPYLQHTATMTDRFGCSAEMGMTEAFTIWPVGIEEREADFGANLRRSGGVLEVRWDESPNELVLYNAAGQEVYRNAAASQHSSIPLTQPGVYILEAIHSGQSPEQIKILW